MIVVSNTSPICYLVLIECVDLLPKLYGEVFIPQAVRDELAALGSPLILRQWIESPPFWLKIESVSMPIDESLQDLDKGESEAILLAQEHKAKLIILDEQKARAIATDKGLTVIGILGVLYQAALQDLVDLKEAIERLKNTNFRASRKLLDSLLIRYREEKRTDL